MERSALVETVSSVPVVDGRIALVRSEVEQWPPSDQRGVISKTRTLAFLDEEVHHFSRHDDVRHFTGSAVVLSSAGTLLHRHRRAGIWCGPGGHVDDGELPSEAAQREVLEETGIKAWNPFPTPLLIHVDVHDTQATRTNHIHYDLRYVFVSMPDEPAPPATESQDVVWLSSEEAVSRTDASFRSALTSAHDLQLQLPR